MENVDTYKLLQALMKRIMASDPMTILRDYHYGPQAGTFPQELSDVMETLEGLLLFRVEEGENFEHVEREMGMAAIVMLALHDMQSEPEACHHLTYDQDVIVRSLIEGMPYEGLD